MTARKPLVVKNGQTEQLQSGDVIAAGSVASTQSGNQLSTGSDGGLYAAAATYALSSLTDVSVAEGSSIDGYTLNWNNSAGKWEAVAPVSGSGASALSGLSDVNVSEGSSINGYVLYWNNAASKWEAEARSALISSQAGNALSAGSDGGIYIASNPWASVTTTTSGITTTSS